VAYPSLHLVQKLKKIDYTSSIKPNFNHGQVFEKIKLVFFLFENPISNHRQVFEKIKLVFFLFENPISILFSHIKRFLLPKKVNFSTKKL
jgi:hypothetical protein